MNFVDFTKLKDLQEGKSEPSGLLLRKLLGSHRLESAFVDDTDARRSRSTSGRRPRRADYSVQPYPSYHGGRGVDFIPCFVLGKLIMAYEVSFMETAGGQHDTGPKASVIYRFEISMDQKRTRADVVLTEAGAEIIEQGGKDPKSAASIALHRLLKSGRDPFASQISLQIPYGHAAHFSRYGNYDSLPVLMD